MKGIINIVNDILKENDAPFEVEYKLINKNASRVPAVILKNKNTGVGEVHYISDDFFDYEPSEIVKILNTLYIGRMTFSNDIFERECILANVYPKVIDFEGLSGAIEEGHVHYEYLNLLVEYYVRIDDTSTYTLNEEILHQNDIPVEDVIRNANANIIKDARIVGLADAIKNFSGVTPFDMLDAPMLIVSNSVFNYGAGCMASQAILDRISTIVGDEYFILPSSIHELIVTPVGIINDVGFLKAMVREVNDSQVHPFERLSYSVYIYRNGEIDIA